MKNRLISTLLTLTLMPFFGYSNNTQTQKPTNAQFIANLNKLIITIEQIQDETFRIINKDRIKDYYSNCDMSYLPASLKLAYEFYHTFDRQKTQATADAEIIFSAIKNNQLNINNINQETLRELLCTVADLSVWYKYDSLLAAKTPTFKGSRLLVISIFEKYRKFFADSCECGCTNLPDELSSEYALNNMFDSGLIANSCLFIHFTTVLDILLPKLEIELNTLKNQA